MIIKTLYEFEEFEYLYEFVRQYVNYTGCKENANQILYNFVCDTYGDLLLLVRLYGTDHIDKKELSFENFYAFLHESGIYDGEPQIIEDFVEWLPEEYHITECDDGSRSNEVYFKIFLMKEKPGKYSTLIKKGIKKIKKIIN